VVFLNFPRLILELQMTPAEAYAHIQQVLEQVRQRILLSIISPFCVNHFESAYYDDVVSQICLDYSIAAG
jgi:hypothetical protein